MKRMMTTIGLIVFAAVYLKAQSLELGVKTGVGVANTHITSLPESVKQSDVFSPVLSYSVNGSLCFQSKGWFGITAEPGIIQKGWLMNKGEELENKIRLHYLQLPVLADFHATDKWFFSIGPELNYLVKAANKSEYGTEDITDLSRKLELAGAIGCAYKLGSKLEVGLRYSHGLTQTSDKVFWAGETQGDSQREMKDYNQYLQMYLKVNLKRLR
ncbi:PorT family protein [Maribellus sp. CM-23]|uniref:porin family protein n=1 Tax=Maribellus sp. CM-23 TaxID=2781026 RepID=UPI001F1B94C4|nr:porin family protein [Maribellus sp. CM-23]MCE4564155.1 PorT family protein [Maribellus sp. CM-23]